MFRSGKPYVLDGNNFLISESSISLSMTSARSFFEISALDAAQI
jgi:hypothetical protein